MKTFMLKWKEENVSFISHSYLIPEYASSTGTEETGEHIYHALVMQMISVRVSLISKTFKRQAGLWTKCLNNINL